MQKVEDSLEFLSHPWFCLTDSFYVCLVLRLELLEAAVMYLSPRWYVAHSGWLLLSSWVSCLQKRRWWCSLKREVVVNVAPLVFSRPDHLEHFPQPVPWETHSLALSCQLELLVSWNDALRNHLDEFSMYGGSATCSHTPLSFLARGVGWSWTDPRGDKQKIRQSEHRLTSFLTDERLFSF